MRIDPVGFGVLGCIVIAVLNSIFKPTEEFCGKVFGVLMLIAFVGLPLLWCVVVFGK